MNQQHTEIVVGCWCRWQHSFTAEARRTPMATKTPWIKLTPRVNAENGAGRVMELVDLGMLIVSYIILP